MRQAKAANIISTPGESIDIRYKKYLNELTGSAYMSIGKTTIKNNHKAKTSDNVKRMNNQKKLLKNDIQQETNREIRADLIETYKEIQNKVLQEMAQEKVVTVQAKMEKIVSDGSRNALWGEKRRMSRDPALESLALKDKHGVRVYDPDSIKEHTALYFEDLYKAKPQNHHPHHSYVLAKMIVR